MDLNKIQLLLAQENTAWNIDTKGDWQDMAFSDDPEWLKNAIHFTKPEAVPALHALLEAAQDVDGAEAQDELDPFADPEFTQSARDLAFSDDPEYDKGKISFKRPAQLPALEWAKVYESLAVTVHRGGRVSM